MNTIYVVALEPIDQRYTKQWYTAIPDEINKELRNRENMFDYEVVTVDGDSIGESRSDGAFLDFALTNIWKNTQINKISEWFSDGTIKAGDVFLVTDAWHPGIIQIRYMSELLGIPVTIHGIWHAGSYDKTDILGFTIKDKRWSHGFERSVYHALDYNWYGSHYHKKLFCNVLELDGKKAYQSGQPHSSIIDTAKTLPWEEKENIILFGHRISPDKQPDIFEDLAKSLPDYEFVFSQKMNLSKEEYYELIRKSKLSFSANLHENFGISMVEAIFNGTMILVPDRLSYSEMYYDFFKYDSEWTSSFENYQVNRVHLVKRIEDMMADPNKDQHIKDQQEWLQRNYMTAAAMAKGIVSPQS